MISILFGNAQIIMKYIGNARIIPFVSSVICCAEFKPIIPLIILNAVGRSDARKKTQPTETNRNVAKIDDAL